MVVVLGVALVACGALARRYPIAPAILLVLVGFVPRLRQAQLPSEVVLLVFLPALLYWESLPTSLREIRNNLRVMVLTSTALVVATAAAVASTAHGLGLEWGPAWVLGAALAPTDATAVGVLARDLPRGTVTVLRAESLVNDGTALGPLRVGRGRHGRRRAPHRLARVLRDQASVGSLESAVARAAWMSVSSHWWSTTLPDR